MLRPSPVGLYYVNAMVNNVQAKAAQLCVCCNISDFYAISHQLTCELLTLLAEVSAANAQETSHYSAKR